MSLQTTRTRTPKKKKKNPPPQTHKTPPKSVLTM